eukprot:CAMPEP_0174897066 /NCGR_PEP_ID=MMETSP0167-20121228/11538_1 /TAXON_ID=38298 /ORGANISM="Rhodella maculata, Strain CCMP736" /LENGTH=133 /DNA_ID=CAMNT_0016136813 /DNA_START=24 /DNA_END=425 /DNA_ORIENTATION=-
MKTPSSKLFLRLRVATPSSTVDVTSPVDVSSDPELTVPVSPRYPDADRFTPLTNVEMFHSEYSTAYDLGMQLSPRKNKKTDFEKQMASDEKAKRFVRSKDSNKGAIGRLGEMRKNKSDVTERLDRGMARTSLS